MFLEESSKRKGTASRIATKSSRSARKHLTNSFWEIKCDRRAWSGQVQQFQQGTNRNFRFILDPHHTHISVLLLSGLFLLILESSCKRELLLRNLLELLARSSIEGSDELESLNRFLNFSWTPRINKMKRSVYLVVLGGSNCLLELLKCLRGWEGRAEVWSQANRSESWRN